MLIAAGVIVWVIVKNINEGHPVSTNIYSKDKDSIPFPRFTVCNTNLLKKSYVLAHRHEVIKLRYFFPRALWDYLEYIFESANLNSGVNRDMTTLGIDDHTEVTIPGILNGIGPITQNVVSNAPDVVSVGRLNRDILKRSGLEDIKEVLSVK